MPYRVHGADLEKATNVLTLTMTNYPVFTYVMPKSTDRKERLHHVLRFILNVGSYEGEVVAPSEDIEAIAIWLRSDDRRRSPRQALLSGFAALPLRVGMPTMNRLLRLAKSKQTQRTKILAGRYCLLDMLGVDPRLQS
jgi:hypothetical protein